MIFGSPLTFSFFPVPIGSSSNSNIMEVAENPFNIEINSQEGWFVVLSAPQHVSQVRVQVTPRAIIDVAVPQNLGRRIFAPALLTTSDDNILVECFMELEGEEEREVLLDAFPVPLT